MASSWWRRPRAGTPSVVVAGPENAATELVDDGVNGVVSPDASPESLAAALERVLEAGSALRESTARWFAENAPTLRIDRSLELVAESYAAHQATRMMAIASFRTTTVPPRSGIAVHPGSSTT